MAACMTVCLLTSCVHWDCWQLAANPAAFAFACSVWDGTGEPEATSQPAAAETDENQPPSPAQGTAAASPSAPVDELDDQLDDQAAHPAAPDGAGSAQDMPSQPDGAGPTAAAGEVATAQQAAALQGAHAAARQPAAHAASSQPPGTPAADTQVAADAIGEAATGTPAPPQATGKESDSDITRDEEPETPGAAFAAILQALLLLMWRIFGCMQMTCSDITATWCPDGACVDIAQVKRRRRPASLPAAAAAAGGRRSTTTSPRVATLPLHAGWQRRAASLWTQPPPRQLPPQQSPRLQPAAQTTRRNWTRNLPMMLPPMTLLLPTLLLLLRLIRWQWMRMQYQQVAAPARQQRLLWHLQSSSLSSSSKRSSSKRSNGTRRPHSRLIRRQQRMLQLLTRWASRPGA